LPLALWSGFALRLSEWWPQKYLFASWPLFLIILIAGIFMRLGLYHAIVRFMGAQAFWTVSKGVFLFQIDPFLRSILIGFALVYLVGSRLLMIVLGKIVIS
jgi:FlaA1/EpsC-like NDP-sugar epimerase